MKLGAFSISLAVKDLNTSKVFYEKLGFHVYAGEMEKNYLILKNETTTIGLFQGMFPNNIMTFNPGWDDKAQPIEDWLDVRKIQAELKSKGLEVGDNIDASSEGPASFFITDPDGNAILIDQHR